jgi:regulator of nonsense transcripts 1
MKGELTIELNHTAPPEMARMDWKMFNAGSIGTSNALSQSQCVSEQCVPATSRAMMDAIIRLYKDGDSCCAFQRFITCRPPAVEPEDEDIGQDDAAPDADDHLNLSQRKAVQSCDAPLSLIWGPPGE